MMELLAIPSDNVIGVKISGKIEKADLVKPINALKEMLGGHMALVDSVSNPTSLWPMVRSASFHVPGARGEVLLVNEVVYVVGAAVINHLATENGSLDLGLVESDTLNYRPMVFRMSRLGSAVAWSASKAASMASISTSRLLTSSASLAIG